MAQVPTSPLRVFPQAVPLDTQALAGPSFDDLMGSFSTGAKLPLLMEQIKHEKKRIKLENAKLDFAESEAGRQQEAEARAAEVALKQAQARNVQAQAALSEQALDDATTYLNVPELGAAAEPPPLADVSSIGAEAPAAPEAAPVTKYVPDEKVISREFGRIQQTDNPSAVAQQQVSSRLKEMFPRGVSVAKRNEYIKERDSLAEKYKPQPAQKTFTDSNGMPMTIDVVKVGDEVVQVLPDTLRIDVEKLPEAQKKADAEIAKTLSSSVTGESDRLLTVNLQQLDFASDILRRRGALATGGIVSTIPEWIRKRVPGLQEGMAAKDAVRSVVQQTLRQTLGAQFARVEGEMMLDRAFSDAQPPEENHRRIGLLRQEIERYAANKRAAAAYFAANNTLAGFPGLSLDAMAEDMASRWKEETGVEQAAPVSPADDLTKQYLSRLQRKQG